MCERHARIVLAAGNVQAQAPPPPLTTDRERRSWGPAGPDAACTLVDMRLAAAGPAGEAHRAGGLAWGSNMRLAAAASIQGRLSSTCAAQDRWRRAQETSRALLEWQQKMCAACWALSVPPERCRRACSSLPSHIPASPASGEQPSLPVHAITWLLLNSTPASCASPCTHTPPGHRRRSAGSPCASRRHATAIDSTRLLQPSV